MQFSVSFEDRFCEICGEINAELISIFVEFFDRFGVESALFIVIFGIFFLLSGDVNVEAPYYGFSNKETVAVQVSFYFNEDFSDVGSKFHNTGSKFSDSVDILFTPF